MSHCCHAVGCARQVPPRMLMCLQHWKMVAIDLQRAIWSEYRPGQEDDKKPSLIYMGVQRVAVGQVAEKEGRDDAATSAYLEAVRFLVLAKRAGESFKDPKHAEVLNKRLKAEDTVRNAAEVLNPRGKRS